MSETFGPAGWHHCAILLIRHLTKLRSFQALYRGGGSIGIVGACRSAWLTAANPDHPTLRVLAQVKNNLAGPQPSLSYEIVPPTEPSDQPTIQWLGPSPWSATQLLAAAAVAPRRSPRARARDFLSSALAKGPSSSRELWTLAQEQRLASRTVTRAKRDLQIRSLRVIAAGQRLSYWLLPGQELPPGVQADIAPPNLEPWLAPLREKYPPSNPLDEPLP